MKIKQDGTMVVLNREVIADSAMGIMIFREMHVIAPSILKPLEMTTFTQKVTTSAMTMLMILDLATEIGSIREEDTVTAPTETNNDFKITADTRIEIIQDHQEMQDTTMVSTKEKAVTDRMTTTIHSSKDRIADPTIAEGARTMIHAWIHSSKIP